MNMDREQLEHNLTNHTPSADDITKIEELRAAAKTFGSTVLDLCPESREKSLAITNLEQSLMWAVASIARHR